MRGWGTVRTKVGRWIDAPSTSSSTSVAGQVGGVWATARGNRGEAHRTCATACHTQDIEELLTARVLVPTRTGWSKINTALKRSRNSSSGCGPDTSRIQDCMSTAFLKRSLHDLEFSVGRRLSMEQHQAWTCVLPASETQQLPRRTAAAASARRRAFEKVS